MIKCKFITNSGVKCGHNALVSSGFCITHSAKRCNTCGAQATHECGEVYGCIYLLCNANYCIMDHDIEKHSSSWVNKKTGV